MALAGKTLFVAGPLDVVDEEEIFAKPFDKQLAAKAAVQVASLRGKGGALLVSVSTADGKKLGELKLDASPVFDGLAAADGRLYLATTDGNLICLAGQ